MKEKKHTRVLLFIIANLLLILYMLPFVLVIINSAKPSLKIIMDPLALPEKPSLLFANIKTIFENPNIRFGSSFFSTIAITVSSVGLIVLISSMAAWVLVRTKTKLSNIVFMMFVAAMIIPFQAVMFPLISWLHLVEVKLGLFNTPFHLLQNYTGIIFAYLGFGSSLSIFLFHGFIKSIPIELEESATIDGCSRPATFFKIVFPLLSPITVTVIILNGMWIWNDYLLPLMVLGSSNTVMTMPLALASFVGSFVKKWDLILTATLMMMIPIIVVFIILQKYIIKGMVEGSVKG
jgi:raffinose/stachyose/melibiose transport system permease protein